jgi:hypothetical protein
MTLDSTTSPKLLFSIAIRFYSTELKAPAILSGSALIESSGKFGSNSFYLLSSIRRSGPTTSLRLPGITYGGSDAPLRAALGDGDAFALLIFPSSRV